MILHKYQLSVTTGIYDCKLCNYSASTRHPNCIITHLQDVHGINRSSNEFSDYVRSNFGFPSCACGCGKSVALRKRKLVFNLFAVDCENRYKFTNPKCPESHLFEGKSVSDTISDIARIQSAIAIKSNSIEHRNKLSTINSGSNNPSSVKSIALKSGLTIEDAKKSLVGRTAGNKNGFYGKTHTDDVKKKLAIARSNQSKIVSKPELVIWGMLKALGIDFKFQEPIDKFVVDFVVGNTIIEVYGDYWHGPKMSPSNRRRDIDRSACLKSMGYEIIIVWESVLFTDTESVLLTLRQLCA